MTPDQYRKAGEIYHAALAVAPDRRAEFLERACAGDDELLSEVESLLAAHVDAGEIFEAPHPLLNTLLSLSGVESRASSEVEALGLSEVEGESVQDLSSEERERWLRQRPPDSAAADRDASLIDLTESTLVPGQRLGRYEVLDLLGAGGMGTVYRALDSSLGREVAIKALAQMFGGDSVSLRRFEREARVLATLSHPNIATIYGFERLNGSPYLILERVDGVTLADRVRRGAMPVEEALGVAEQIVAGLEEAHGKGVIHRDLKPSNVMLTRDGRVKLVDFGLAKTVSPRQALEASQAITAAGLVLGTARYMSPEQMKGEPVDMRADVWAFGCVLYEMLTARPAFAGRSMSEVVAAVLRDDPDWKALPRDTPRNVSRLLRRCLRRDPRARLQHIGDARLELTESENEPGPDAVSATRATTRWRVALLIAAAVAATALGLLVYLRPTQTVAPPRLTRLSLELPARVALASEYSAPFAIAPNGSAVVIEGREGGTEQLYVRDVSDSALRVLPGTEGAWQPFFSPDGAWVAFFTSRKLVKVPIGGGQVLELADVGGNPRGASWAPDGTIVLAPTQTSGLVRVPDTGGRLMPLTTLDKARGESSHRWPDVLPGGRWVLFTVGLEDAPFDEARIEAVSIDSGERRLVLSGAGLARYLPSGHLLFVRGGHLQAVELDVERLVTRGTPEVVLDPVRYDWRNGGGHLAVSPSGALLYTPGEPTSSEFYLAWADGDGRLTRVSDTARKFRDVKVSPDGRRIASVIGASTESDLWLVDANGTLSQLTYGLSPHRPTWIPNGDGVTVGAEKSGTWRLFTFSTEGAGDPIQLFESANRLYPNSWSPDGRYLVFQENRPETGWDLRVLEIDASGHRVGEPRELANTPFHESRAAISLDGRWVSYESDELDATVQVYVRSFPDGTHKVRASMGGARWPAWDTRGNLYFWHTGQRTLHVIPTGDNGEQPLVGTAQEVWRGSAAPNMLSRIVVDVTGARYDVAPGGTRFLVLEQSADGSGPELSHPMLVLGWRPAAGQ